MKFARELIHFAPAGLLLWAVFAVFGPALLSRWHPLRFLFWERPNRVQMGLYIAALTVVTAADAADVLSHWMATAMEIGLCLAFLLGGSGKGPGGPRRRRRARRPRFGSAPA